MSNQDSLHELVHSLSGPEKRYFRVQESHSGKLQKYMALFNAVEEMEKFELDKLEAWLSWKNFKVNYAATKRYLHQKILHALKNYQQVNSVGQQLEVLVSEIQLLRGRQLHQQASRKVALAKRLCYKAQNFIRLVEVLNEERALLARHRGKVATKDELAVLFAEFSWASEGLRLDQKVRHINSLFFACLNAHGGASAELPRPELQDLIMELDNLNVLEAPYFFPALFYHNIHNQYALTQGDDHRSTHHLEMAVALFERHPQMKKENPRRYLATLHNYGNRCAAIHKHEAQLGAIRAISSFKSKDPAIKTQKRESVFSLGSGLILNAGQTSENAGFIGELSRVVHEHVTGFSKRFLLGLRSRLVSIAVLEEDFPSALAWLETVLRDSEHKKLTYMERLLAIVEMLVHYELGNYDLLEYKIRNRLKAIQKDSLFDFERFFSLYLRKLMQAQGPKHAQSLSEELLIRLEAIKTEGRENQVFRFFDFEVWVRSRALGKSFKHVKGEEWKAVGGVEVRLDSLVQDLQ